MAAKFHSFFLGFTYSVGFVYTQQHAWHGVKRTADFKAALAKTTVGATAAPAPATEGEL